MPTIASSFIQRALIISRPLPPPSIASRPRLARCIPARIGLAKPRIALIVASSAASFDELDARGRSRPRSSMKSILSNLVQEIEPLDLSLIQKDIPADTVDAMKRTISGMLGLLPSDQFHVLIEAFWEPLFKLLISSMMTGYTLRNAENRLCLEKNLNLNEEICEKQECESIECDDNHELVLDGASTSLNFSGIHESLPNTETIEEAPICENMDLESLGEMTTEAQKYILSLQSRLSSVKKELCDIKRKNSALQMQQFVGEEKNDLLDYLRSLHPEKVAELSEPTCPDVQETIHSVAHGLLATLSPKMHSTCPQTENSAGEALNVSKDDCPELVENTSLHFQPQISVSRDYLARLLFWCMLLGHHIRGLEYRLELMQLLTISSDPDSVARDGDYAA